MSNKKQSSVEWLVDYIKNLEKYPYKTIQELEEKAKAMHKEEIITANRDGVDMIVDKKPYTTGVQYYNETFGGNNEKNNK